MQWKVKESPHYRFHYHSGSTAERDLCEIIVRQEACYRHICEVLRVQLNFKIGYFLCETREEVGAIFTDVPPGNGFSTDSDVYAVYNESLQCVGPHEDAHVISWNTLGHSTNPMVREGLSMFFDREWWGVPNYAWVHRLLSKGNYPPLTTIAPSDQFYGFEDKITYPLVGAFTEYLIITYGIDKYKTLYRTCDQDLCSAFNEVYQKSLGDVDANFQSYIRTLKISQVLRNSILELI